MDSVTLIVALLYAIFVHFKESKLAKRNFICRDTGLTVAHGVALFPLVLLAFSSFSSLALEQLLHSHKIILSVAGFVALLAVLEEKPAD